MNTFKKHWLQYVLLTLTVIILVVTVGYAFTTQLYSKFHSDRIEVQHPIIAVKENEAYIPPAFADETLNILLMATDVSGFRTDSMLVIHYDQNTQTTSLFSIPRDYKVPVSDELKTLIHYKRDFIKFTEFHSYAKSANYESPASLTAQAVEELLNIEIDHLVLINIDGFKQVVDSVGGVEVNVPQKLKYDDPTQNLHIDLEPGLQTLNGDQAEQFVRFRKNNSNKGYGDFGRMEMQQYFLTAYVKKIFSANSIFNIAQIYGSLTDFVTTDATLEDAVGILKIAKDANLKRIYSHTLPGVNEKVDGIYYLSPPPKAELIDIVQKTIESDKTPLVDSKLTTIKILNGTNKENLAEKSKETLTLAGYTVSDIGTYNGEHTMKTRIFVPREGLGHDLKAFFELSEVIVDPTRFKDEDPEMILVILGSL